MGKYLHDCEVLEMELEIPGEDVREIAGFFDGRHDGGRAGARASLCGRELKLEARGGRMQLTLRGEVFVPDEIEILDDRSAEFFEQVVLSLFATYRGRLRCRVRWAGQRPGSAAEEAEVEVEVDKRRCNWPAPVHPGAWLVASAISEVKAEVRAKLEEARRHYSEYLRLKGEREPAKS